MARKPRDKPFPGSFLDHERLLAGMTMPQLYHALGWSRERYYNHCKDARLLPRSEFPRLAGILNKTVKKLYQEEHEFYFGTTG